MNNLNLKKSNVLFTEKQHFTQWWLWILLIGLILVPLYGLFKQVILLENFGSNPMSSAGLLVMLIIQILFALFFYKISLKTIISPSKIIINFKFFESRTILKSKIKHLEIVNYGFVGGWGLRGSTKYGSVYNVKGKTGLYIILNNNEKLCIGTQKEKELYLIIKNYLND